MKLASLNDGTKDGKLIIVSKDLKYGSISTGAYDDYEKATMIAKMIVTKYCFNNYISIDLQQNSYSYDHISDKHKDKVYAEIESLLENLYENAKTLLSNNMCCLEKIAAKLLEQEEIIKEEIEELVGDKMNSIKIEDIGM